jgi:hypothetical protein
MGYPKGDWAQTRDPKRNAEITREVKKEAAYLQAFRERRARDLPGIEEYINTHIPLNARKSDVDLAITRAEKTPVAPESKILWWIALGGGLS